MFNILQTTKDGNACLMLGCSVDKVTAEDICKNHYIAKLPETNRGRVANGYPPLECVYSVVEVACEFADWLPNDLREETVVFAVSSK